MMSYWSSTGWSSRGFGQLVDNTSYFFLSCSKVLVLSPWLSQECEERRLHSWLTICRIQNSNGSAQSSLLSLLKCTCVSSPMCKSRFGQIEGLVSTVTWRISKGNSAEWLLTIGTSAWEKFGSRERLENGKPTWVTLLSPPPWMTPDLFSGTSLILIYHSLNEKCFDILHSLLCCWQ